MMRAVPNVQRIVVGLILNLVTCGWPASAIAATKTWDGGAGTFSWHDANNWNPVGVPGPSDDVVIDVPGAITVTISTGATINSLTCEENLTLSGGTLNISAASAINGAFTQSGGTLGGAGDVTISGTLNWNVGAMNGTGKTIMAAGSTLTMGGGVGFTKTLSRVLENNGTAGYATDSFGMAGGTFNNMASGIFNASGSGGIFFQGGTDAFNNAGIFNKTGSASFPIAHFVPFNNSGTVMILGGTLSVAETYTQTAGATLNVTVTSVGIAPFACTGNATLAGSLHATASPFPSVSTLYTLLSCGTCSGTFASQSLVPNGALQYRGGTVKWSVNRPGDIVTDNFVNVDDLLAVINAWGACTPPPPGAATCPADIAPPGGNGVVNVDDLLMVINNWG